MGGPHSCSGVFGFFTVMLSWILLGALGQQPASKEYVLFYIMCATVTLLTIVRASRNRTFAFLGCRGLINFGHQQV